MTRDGIKGFRVSEAKPAVAKNCLLRLLNTFRL